MLWVPSLQDGLWNAEQTHCLEIQEVALPGRRDSERQEESLMPLSSLVGPVACAPFPLQNMLGTGDPKKSWGTPKWRSPSWRPWAVGCWLEVMQREDLLVGSVWNILGLPQVFSPILQTPARCSLWEDHLPPKSAPP